MAWIILLVFLACAGSMYSKKLPALLALPIMAVIIALLPAYKHPLEALELVFGTGAPRLAAAMTNAMFGAILAHVVYTCRIAETIVKKASELAGDRAIPVALFMMLATAVGFLALGGLGSVIMVGTLVLPVMIGVGIRPIVASSVLLFGISIGGLWNVAGWGFYQDVLKVPVAQVAAFSTICGITLLVAGVAYVLVNARARRSAWGISPPDAGTGFVSGFALLTPILPVALILGFKYANVLTLGHVPGHSFEINAALTFGSIYGILTTRPREFVNLLTGAITEGVKSVAPVLGLMLGIGMVITALTSAPVTAVMRPALAGIIPHSPLGACPGNSPKRLPKTA